MHDLKDCLKVLHTGLLCMMVLKDIKNFDNLILGRNIETVVHEQFMNVHEYFTNISLSHEYMTL